MKQRFMLEYYRRKKRWIIFDNKREFMVEIHGPMPRQNALFIKEYLRSLYDKKFDFRDEPSDE